MPKRGLPFGRKRDTIDLNRYMNRVRLMDERDETEERDIYRDPREIPLDDSPQYLDEERDRQETPSDRNLFGRNQRGNLLENMIYSAENLAANLLSQKKPRFTELFVKSYVDKKALAKYAETIAPFLQKGQISPQEAHDYLASHIISGDFLTDEGREIILNKSLEEKAGKWWGWHPGGRKARKILKGEKYLDEAMAAFRDIYNLIQSDEHYSRHMPELSQAVTALYDLGFRDATLTALRKNLPEKKYMAAKLGIAEAAKQIGEYLGKTGIGIEKPEIRARQRQNYIDRTFYNSIAAAILAIVGLGIVFTSNNITGNVIGLSAQTNILASIFGASALILGLYFLIKINHSQKS